MRTLTFAAIAALAGFGLTATAPQARAQVGVGVEIGAPPVCPYGYYDVPPYDCAPYGYYGPDWFVNGVFIGAGPWFHGPDRFVGHVDNRYARENYHGTFPAHGEAATHPVNKISGFKGNEMRDGRGHVAQRK